VKDRRQLVDEMNTRIVKPYIFLLLLLAANGLRPVVGQTPATSPPVYDVSRYIDPVGGMTADDAVALALKNNAELEALRREAQAAEALIRQARVRPNPSIELSGSKMLGGPDHSIMMEGELPLELGGRRSARIRIAEQELQVRRLTVAERERQLAAEVRTKFGEALAAILKLKFVDEMHAAGTENYNLVAAQVSEGRRAPLERSMETVELNRMLALHETSEGQTEILLLELRNLIGSAPEEPLRLRGDLGTSAEPLLTQTEAVQQALQTRTDLLGARAVERLAAARTEQARAEGRVDADVMVGYQRMRSGFPLSAFDNKGLLMPIDMRAQYFTFGVKLDLPVRNRNRGMIEASVLEQEAAAKRREFGELTIGREVASAYVRFQRAARAEAIYRVGVRDQAAQNLGVVRLTYELGSKTLLDYIAELRRFIETESAYIDAQRESYLARIDVLRVINSPELIRK
jgi:cobalt-zinc-cadmium efflux system outer membrane protein